MLDPDGDFVSSWIGVHYESQPVMLEVAEGEAALLATMMREP
jgi:hypothetical protein